MYNDAHQDQLILGEKELIRIYNCRRDGGVLTRVTLDSLGQQRVLKTDPDGSVKFEEAAEEIRT